MTNEKEAQEDAWDTGALGRDPKYAAIAPEEVPTPLTDAAVEELYGPLSDAFDTSLAGRFAKRAQKIERALTQKTAEVEALGNDIRRQSCDHIHSMNQLWSENAQLKQEVERIRSQYDELILSVGKKWPNETRHQTVLRYIRQAEVADATATTAGYDITDKGGV